MKAFIIKQILDIQDWTEVIKLLYDKKNKKGKFHEFYYYVSLQPFRDFEEKLQTHPRAKTLELAVVTAMTSVLRFLPEYDSKCTCKTYIDLQKVFHTLLTAGETKEQHYFIVQQNTFIIMVEVRLLLSLMG